VLALVATCAALLLLPVPYRVKCDCELEPVSRRFIAAPFEGPLEQTFVKPGEVVAKDQLLARMDGRDIRWELAGVRADLQRAEKERAGHMAAHESGKAEVARHEVDRLQLRAQLLEARNHDLDVRSPIDGIVVSGDLRETEGMPLKQGQVLFEVAPLDQMVVELAIPEDDVTYVRSEMHVRIRLDAFPMQGYEARVERIHPRAEIRDQENVFIAEVSLNNELGQLHPGMRGRAWIAVGSARLGWVLFRRPVAAAIQWLGW
jgi:multidrug resistance efflux pump